MTAKGSVKDFVFLVAEMRRTQKGYDEMTTGKNKDTNRFGQERARQFKRAAEHQVDAWLAAHALEKRLLINLFGDVKGSEEPASYNLRDETEKS